MNKLVTLIPARGGSKSIPKKNLAKLAGKPLLQYAIEAAMPVTDEVWVSTDDTEIGFFADISGARVLTRPNELCTDVAPTSSAVVHFANSVDFDDLLLLNCTSPLITSDDLQGLLDVYYTGMETLPTVLLDKRLIFRAGIQGNYVTIPERKRRQDFKASDYTYIETDAWVVSREFILAHKDFVGRKNKFYIMSHRNIDIDSELDLKIAEVIHENT